MKSRLLPPPVLEDHESRADALAPRFERRESDREEPREEFAEPTSAPEPPVVQPAASAQRPSPQVSSRPSGRLVVVAVLLVCVSSITYSVWGTFFRDAAYGAVVGQVTALSPQWAGTLTAVYVREGDQVQQGDVLAIVDDPELQASIDRLSDDMRAAQAELDAQAALLALAAQDRGNEVARLRAEYYDLRGQLIAEQARYGEFSSKLQRRQELSKRHAVSGEEVESLEYVLQGSSAKVEHLKLAVAAMERRLDALPDSMHDAAQLKPWLAKIENYQSEILRLREKQHRGKLRAPVGGKVVSVSGRVGEQVSTGNPLVELLPDGALELVLYISQDRVFEYQREQRVEVVVGSASETIACRVTRIGQRFEKPDLHVSARYHPNERFLPVYLTPISGLSDLMELRLGSTVRQPTKLFRLSQ